MKSSMKSRDKDRTGVLRMLLSELKYVQANKSMNEDLSDDEALKVIISYEKRLVKSLADYPDGEQKDKINSEIGIVQTYLPAKATEQEMAAAVDAAIAGADNKVFGVLMKQVMGQFGASADGKLISKLLKEKLG